MKYLVLMQALLSSASYQDIIVGGFSYHVGSREFTYNNETRHVNEVNPTIGVEKDGWQLAVMENSYYKPSVMYSYTWDWSANNWVYGIKTGLVTGYKNTPVGYQILPFAQAELGYRYKDVTTILGYMPTKHGGALTLHWKIAY